MPNAPIPQGQARFARFASRPAFDMAGYGFAYDADACAGAACDLPGAHKANPFIGTGKSNFARE